MHHLLYRTTLQSLIVFILFTLLSQATYASAPTVEWVIPSSASLDCKQHESCFSTVRKFYLILQDDTALSEISFETDHSGSWAPIYTEGLSGDIINYAQKLDFSTLLNGQDNLDMNLRAVVTDVQNQQTVSSTLPIKIDNIPPVLKVLETDNEIINFTNNPNNYTQPFQLYDPIGSSASSGLNFLNFQIYKHVSGEWYTDFTGVSGSTYNLPATNNGQSEQVTVNFNWDNTLNQGYYWVGYNASDQSVLSEGAGGEATLFNQGYGDCAADDGGICSHITGGRAHNEFYPLVIDTTPPWINNVLFNDSNTFPSRVTQGAIDIGITATDAYSWLKGGKIIINGNTTPFALPKALNGNTNISLPQDIFTDGDNDVMICVSDYATNEKCLSFVVNSISPAPVITVDWTADISYLDVNFSSSIDPSDTPVDNYKWDFGDGTSSTSPTPHHKYNSPGSYVVKLTVYPSSSSQPVSSTSTITVASPPTNPPQPTPAPPPNNSGGGGGTIIYYNDSPAVTIEDDYGEFDSDPLFYFADDAITGYVREYIYFDLTVSPELEIITYYWEPLPGREEQTEIPELEYIYQEPGIFRLLATARDKNGNFHVADILVNILDRGSVAGITDPTEIASVDRAFIGLDDIFGFAKTYPFLCGGMFVLFGFIVAPLLKRRSNNNNSEYRDDSSGYPNLMRLAGIASNNPGTRNLVMPRQQITVPSPIITPPSQPES